MLFERIRRTQKPVFIFLAITFALGFAFLGVGSGSGGFNPFDLFSSSSTSSSSISDLSSKVAKSPGDADTWLRLAQAYQTDGQTEQAILAYQRYIALRPNDQLQLGTLAGLLEGRADRVAQRAQTASAQAAAVQDQGGGLATSQLKLAPGLSQPLTTTLAQPFQDRANVLSQQAQADYTQAVALRRKLAKTDPTNSTWQFQLGVDAINARDYATALAAFKAYLKLVPDAPNKTQIQQTIKQLQLIAGTSAPGQGG
jgi:cytochrome c-type biogenesis protein CcmH/NrfG